MVSVVFHKIAKSSPFLKVRLKQAGIDLKPEEFVKRTVVSTSYIVGGLSAFVFLLLAKSITLSPALLLLVPILFVILFLYMLKLPEFKMVKWEKDINREIVFAGRFLVVELESGVSLYNALANISTNFKVVGGYTREIVKRVELGTNLEDALSEASEINPSSNFRRVMWQILNSIRTGAEVSKSLVTVIEQISKEQYIEINRYGKKLNPLAMFYMIIAVIMPTLGLTMLIILASFVDIKIGFEIFVVLLIFLTFMQFMFLSIIRFSRPPIEF
tara:strand:- start:2631 stop:3446 length:816 start_codon:yes stop_codon:yes gene_type:complete